MRDSGMRPDIVLNSRLTKQVLLLELTVPLESEFEEQHVFKLTKFKELVAELRLDGNPTDFSH